MPPAPSHTGLTSTPGIPLSGHPHLSPTLLWSLVAIILVNVLLLVLWFITRYRRAAARKAEILGLQEASTSAGAPRVRRFWSCGLSRFTRRTSEVGGAMETAEPKADSSVSETLSSADLEAGMVVVLEEASSPQKDSDKLHLSPAWQYPHLEVHSEPGTPALTIGTSCRSTPEPLQDTVSTFSVYSQASWPDDYSAFMRCDPIVGGTGITEKADLGIKLDEETNQGSDKQATHSEVSRIIVEDPDFLPTTLSNGSPGTSFASELFQDSKPEPAFELAVAAVESLPLGLDKLAWASPVPSVSNAASLPPDILLNGATFSALSPPWVLHLGGEPFSASFSLAVSGDTRKVGTDVSVYTKFRTMPSHLPSPWSTFRALAEHSTDA
ncbi:uncharacterized protein B0H18DRAFT_1106263 [Fomitopsis serialis]|uniref:uncharacterized protein n=1 Tax=Fomitopsis serialis TaxID=139415 RepID=UPI0020076600|nr:uncharacterized protein B0H18DRAFT_1106263 [Neoantrodia serialis]KAH9920375.1 hypothetical protein B0H18DRAFT_1106263 [Neoantrodia serialis]